MAKPVSTRSALAASAVQTTLMIFAFVACGAAHAANSCPQVSGAYGIAGETRSVEGVLRVLGVGLPDYAGGSLFIAPDEHGRLVVQVRPIAGDPLRTYATRTLQTPLDYSCKGGWMVMQSQTKSNLNIGLASYEGLFTLRFKPLVSSEDDSLQLELTFKGHKTVTLFSYDSARIEIGIPWSRYSNTTKLEWLQTASRVPPLAQPAAAQALVESPAVQRLRQALTPALMQDIRLNELAPVAKGVIARIAVRRTQDLVALEERLQTAGLVFVVVGKPVWTSQGYLVELLFP